MMRRAQTTSQPRSEHADRRVVPRRNRGRVVVSRIPRNASLQKARRGALTLIACRAGRDGFRLLVHGPAVRRAGRHVSGVLQRHHVVHLRLLQRRAPVHHRHMPHHRTLFTLLDSRAARKHRWRRTRQHDCKKPKKYQERLATLRCVTLSPLRLLWRPRAPGAPQSTSIVATAAASAARLATSVARALAIISAAGSARCGAGARYVSLSSHARSNAGRGAPA